LPSELNAAVLDSQLESFDEIQARRFSIWNRYSVALEQWAEDLGVELMRPADGIHAAHLFYLLMPDWDSQTDLLEHLRALGIMATFHYVPLGSSPAGLKFGRMMRPLVLAEDFSRRLVRLPLWTGVTDDQVTRVIDGVLSFGRRAPASAPLLVDTLPAL
jgi:dTDP-4-amino-4,6-dideoxygalactose transaminase